MNITAPITDYIPASMLTTQGDMIVRGAVNLQRLATVTAGRQLESQGGGLVPAYNWLDGALNSYLKGAGAGLAYNFAPLALRDTGVFIGSSMRNSAGNQVIAGIGFESSIIIFLATDTTIGNLNWSVGVDQDTAKGCMYQFDNGVSIGISTTYGLFIRRGAVNSLVGQITTIGADGFTLNWTLAGACAVDFIYLCLP